MEEIGWPELIRHSRLSILLTQGLRGVARISFWNSVILFIAICFFYKFIVVYAVIPDANISAVQNTIKQWWFFDYIDLFITGGAFRAASIFSPGIISLFPMFFIAGFSKKKPTFLFGRYEFVLVCVIVFIISGWFRMQGIIPGDFWHFGVSATGMLAASYVLRLLWLGMLKKGLPNLVSIFGVYVAFDFFKAAILQYNYYRIAFSFIFFVLLFTGYIVLRQKKVTFHVKSLRSNKVCASELNLPWCSVAFLLNVTRATAAYSILLNASASVFIPKFSPEISWFIPCLLLPFILVLSYFSVGQELFALLEGVDCVALASSLRTNYFMINRICPGHDTELFLRKKTSTLSRNGFVACFVVIFVFSCFYSLYLLLPGEASIPCGMYGTINTYVSILLLCVTFVEMSLKLGSRKINKYKWVYGGSSTMAVNIVQLSSGQNEMGPEANWLSIFNPEHRERIQNVLSQKKGVRQCWGVMQIMLDSSNTGTKFSLLLIFVTSLIAVFSFWALNVMICKFILPNITPNLKEYLGEIYSYGAVFASLVALQIKLFRPDIIRPFSKLKDFLFKRE
ncbi:hypothetical protein [Maridesulfovibrio sp.]|uniref:hypothetical protein n=1 Tax=Maridesulfovibrio sp. TaxID=2795000 RepID=UPI002A188A59|nr:hypothetical protein [Maridesulfovibrio sp.]